METECPFLKRVAEVEEERKGQSYEQLVPIRAIKVHCNKCGHSRTAVWKVTGSKEAGFQETIIMDKCPLKLNP